MNAPPASWFDTWPNGQPHTGAPTAAAWVAQLAGALADHLENTAETVASFATRAGIAETTVRGLLRGEQWPALATAVTVIEALR